MSLPHSALEPLAFSTSALPPLPVPLLFLPSSSSPSTSRHRRPPCFQMKLRDSPHQNHNQWKEEELELWKARRGISRTVLKPVAMLSRRKDKIMQARIAKGKDPTGGKKEEVKNAVVATALLLAVVTAVAR
ncbi:Hypothetical protein NocV09_07400110 [Nannochloropsis oceanica]